MVAEEPILALGFIMIGLFYYSWVLKDEDRMMSIIFRSVAFFLTWMLLAVSGTPINIVVFCFVVTAIPFVLHLYLGFINMSLVELIRAKRGKEQKEWSDEL